MTTTDPRPARPGAAGSGATTPVENLSQTVTPSAGLPTATAIAPRYIDLTEMAHMDAPSATAVATTTTGAFDTLVKPITTAPVRRRDPWWLRDGVRPLLVIGDLVACTIAVVTTGARTTTIVFAVMLVALYAWGGLYRSRLSLSLLDGLPRLIGRWLAAVSLTLLLQAARNEVRWGEEIIYWSLFVTAAVALFLLLVLRSVAYATVRRLRRNRTVAHRTLVLGAGQIGAEVAQVLTDHPEYGLEPVGFLDSNPMVGRQSPLPVLGPTSDLYEVLVKQNIRTVLVAFSTQRESAMVDVIRTCDRLRCEIFLVPRLFEVHQVSDDMDTVWGLPLVRLRRATHRSPGWHVKRMCDITVASLALIALAPLMLLTAAAVRLEGGPGVLFRQERVGVDGRRFAVLKFRSLRPANENESATMWNVAQDHRMGRVGKFLRKTSVDELPQLFNILKGEMSLVGPRPERPHFVDQFREAYPHYVARHRVPSGLTGWAQVHGLRGDTSIAERARFDNYYIENWSLWLDAKIMLRTVSSVLRGDGA